MLDELVKKMETVLSGNDFQKRLTKIENEILTVFDRCVFESIVEKVIIDEIDENGNPNPYKLIFVYKTGFFNTVQSKMHKQLKKLTP